MRTRFPLAALFLAALPLPAAAQGWIEIEHPRRPGIVPGGVARIASEVRVSVAGRVATVDVAERFRNDGGALAEGSYLYPVPRDAVFESFSLWVGTEEVQGEMLRAEEARGIYEEIVRRRKDPALLTLEGHGLIRARVFPIQPGETRQVRLRYRHVLEREGDALRVRYAVAPVPAARGHGDDSPRPIAFRLEGADRELGTPYSPTHDIRHDVRNGRLEVTAEPTGAGTLELFLPLRRGGIGTSLVAHAPGGEDGYFLLFVNPPAPEAGRAIPRDLTLVVDVSGSMAGEKMEQARAALRQALATLGPRDRFRVIAFASDVRQFRDGWAPATRATLDEARAFVDGLRASGGTNIEGALEAALATDTPEGRLPLVLFATDGQPSVGERQPDRLADRAASALGGRRIFPVGIGHDVNTYLLDRLARDGRGSAEYVAPGASVETALGSLTDRMRFPALTDLRIVSSPVRFDRLAPGDLPDLFAGEELVLVGRYQGEGHGDVIIEGRRDGRAERVVVRGTFPRRDGENAFVSRLWATRRVGELTRQLRLEGPNPEMVEEIRTLALRHGILTEYTSYLVLEPGMDPRNPQPLAMERPAAPAAQAGAAYFRRAEESAELQKSSTLATADAAANRRAEREARADGTPIRSAGGRTFRLRDGAWTDAAHAPSRELVRVKAWSPAYFELARALPEIVPALQAGDEVIVAGRKVSVRVGAEGLERWEAGALARLVRNFRGQ
ncbi:MAG TPA: VIT domain-containing protein [Gemmatimonadales bacterium]|nr:VIT domain-containing protein [Gemmatimonadales bacterium]